MTIWDMPIACWIPKATNTHPEYAILTAFPLHQCLHERHTYIACLVICVCSFPFYVFLFLPYSFFSQEIQNETKAQMDGRVDFMYTIDCKVKEFKWGILERVLLFLRKFIFVQFTKTNTRSLMYTHTQNVCKQLPLSCRYFPWFRLLFISLPGMWQEKLPLRLYVVNYCLSKVLISLWN